MADEPQAQAPVVPPAPRVDHRADAARSLREQMRARRRAGQAQRTTDIEIPGFAGSELFIVCRALGDYHEERQIAQRVQDEKVHDVTDQELNVAADSLVLAGVGSYVKTDGQRVDLGASLGIALCDALDPPGGRPDGEPPLFHADSDRQAVFELFPDTSSVVLAYMQLNQFTREAGYKTDEELQGNSPAAS